jgi:hypothetical protein
LKWQMDLFTRWRVRDIQTDDSQANLHLIQRFAVHQQETNTGAPLRSAAHSRVERVAQAVAEEGKAHHDERDADGRRQE